MTAQMVTPDIDKLTIQQYREQRGLSKHGLAKLAGVSTAAVRAIEDPNHQYCTSNGVALRVTKALGIEVVDVRWLHGRSDVGRPVNTGKPIHRPILREAKTCPVHNILLPASGVCDDCS